MNEVVHIQIVGEIALIAIDYPPVNSLSLAVRLGLQEALQSVQRDDRVRAIVLFGRGKGFSAGGDIKELGTPASTAPPGLSLHIHAAIEASSKPVIAALHGLALGGGFETALACHYRIAQSQTLIALPEVKLGIMPLSGTQRLPRLMPVGAAVEMILGAEKYRAADFRKFAIFDRLLDEPQVDIGNAGLAFAREVLERGGSHPLVRDRPIYERDAHASIAKERERWTALSQAQLGTLNAIAAAVEAPDFDTGLARARDIYDTLLESDGLREGRAKFLESRDSSEK